MPRITTKVTDQERLLAEQRDLIMVIEQYLAANGEDGRAMSVKDFADLSSIHPATMSGILSGNRRAATMTRETIENLAKALRLPVLQVYALCGHIKPQDLFYTASPNETLSSLYRVMRADKAFGARCPDRKTWESWPESARLAVAMLYEEISHRRLLNYASF